MATIELKEQVVTGRVDPGVTFVIPRLDLFKTPRYLEPQGTRIASLDVYVQDRNNDGRIDAIVADPNGSAARDLDGNRAAAPTLTIDGHAEDSHYVIDGYQGSNFAISQKAWLVGGNGNVEAWDLAGRDLQDTVAFYDALAAYQQGKPETLNHSERLAADCRYFAAEAEKKGDHERAGKLLTHASELDQKSAEWICEQAVRSANEPELALALVDAADKAGVEVTSLSETALAAAEKGYLNLRDSALVNSKYGYPVAIDRYSQYVTGMALIGKPVADAMIDTELAKIQDLLYRRNVAGRVNKEAEIAAVASINDKLAGFSEATGIEVIADARLQRFSDVPSNIAGDK
ncbi:MAG TPA: hypothetical protein DEP85_01995 [Holosporales bacterium]|nr:hypothetical protein [Holosporales bacterium]